LVSRIYKELQKLNTKRINNLLNKRANEQLSKEEIANKNMKKYSISLAIKEMQTKASLEFHLSQSERLSRKQTTTNAGEEGREGAIHCWGNVNSYSHYGNQYKGYFKN
jgi:hypothetical protein